MAEDKKKAGDAFEHPTWLYHPQHGAKLFDEGEAHPGSEWRDTPAAFNKAG